MATVTQMLQTHPRRPLENLDTISQCVEACFQCAATCGICADACLAEDSVRELVRCIRLNLDCSAICDATGHMVSRMSEPDAALLHRQLEACMEACRVCAEECEMHASHHEHCRICAEECRRCQQACQALLQTMTIAA